MSSQVTVREWITATVNKEYSFAGGALQELLNGTIKHRSSGGDFALQEWDDLLVAIEYLVRRANQLGQSTDFVLSKIQINLSRVINNERNPIQDPRLLTRFSEIFSNLSSEMGTLLALNSATPFNLLIQIHESCQCQKLQNAPKNCAIVLTTHNILSNPKTPIEILSRYANSDDEKLRSQVASNPGITEDLISNMWLDFTNRNLSFYLALLSNVATPRLIRDSIAKSSVKRMLDRRMSTPAN